MKIFLALFLLWVSVTSSLPLPHKLVMEYLMRGKETARVTNTLNLAGNLYKSFCFSLEHSNIQDAHSKRQSILLVVHDAEYRSDQRSTTSVTNLFSKMLLADEEEAKAAPAAFLSRRKRAPETDDLKEWFMAELQTLDFFYPSRFDHPMEKCRLLKVESLSAVLEYLALTVFRMEELTFWQQLFYVNSLLDVMQGKADKFVESVFQSSLPAFKPLPVQADWTPLPPTPHTVENWSIADIENVIHNRLTPEEVVIQKRPTNNNPVEVNQTYSTFSLREYVLRVEQDALIMPVMTAVGVLKNEYTRSLRLVDRFVIYNATAVLNYMTRMAMIEYFVQDRRMDTLETMLPAKDQQEQKRKIREHLLMAPGGHRDHIVSIQSFIHSKNFKALSVGGRKAMSQLISTIHYHLKTTKALHTEDMLYQYDDDDSNLNENDAHTHNVRHFQRGIKELKLVKQRLGLRSTLFMTVLKSLANDYFTAITWNHLTLQGARAISTSIRQVIQ